MPAWFGTGNAALDGFGGGFDGFGDSFVGFGDSFGGFGDSFGDLSHPRGVRSAAHTGVRDLVRQGSPYGDEHEPSNFSRILEN